MDINQLLVRLDDCKTGQEEADLIHEYTRIQIEKNRKRIKEAYYTKIKKAIPELDDLLSSTPITLD